MPSLPPIASIGCSVAWWEMSMSERIGDEGTGGLILLSAGRDRHAPPARWRAAAAQARPRAAGETIGEGRRQALWTGDAAAFPAVTLTRRRLAAAGHPPPPPRAAPLDSRGGAGPRSCPGGSSAGRPPPPPAGTPPPPPRGKNSPTPQ